MEQVAIIGNSHVGAVKQAFDAINVEGSFLPITFYAARGRNIAKMKAEAGCLVPLNEKLADDLALTSGGSRTIDLSKYKKVIIVGCHFFIPQHIRKGTPRNILDDIFFRMWKTCAAARLYELLVSQKYPGEIDLVPCPMPASGSVNPDLYVSERDLSYGEKLHLATEFLSRQGVDLRLLGQPPSTRVNSNFTLNEMTMGSIALNASHDNTNRMHSEADRFHMNEAYGLEVLRMLGMYK